jgi:hypothetical protein
MKTIRATASIAVAILATLGLLFAVTSADTSSVQRTIEKSRVIEANFKQAAAFVDAHIQQEGRLPTPKEFERWAERFPSRPYTINGVRLDLPPYPSEFTLKYGQPPEGGYVLSYWRGEWEESYVSWTKQSSLTFDQSAYYMFGSSLAQAALGVAFALCTGLGAFKLWPWRHAA